MQVGTILEDGLDLPTDDSGATLGFALIQLASQQEAAAAIRMGNGHRLDAAHTLVVNALPISPAEAWKAGRASQPVKKVFATSGSATLADFPPLS